MSFNYLSSVPRLMRDWAQGFKHFNLNTMFKSMVDTRPVDFPWTMKKLRLFYS
jgi:hypothetical protein